MEEQRKELYEKICQLSPGQLDMFIAFLDKLLESQSDGGIA